MKEKRKEKRVYPRIDSDWPLFLSSEEGKKGIGFIKNISLSGAQLAFFENYILDSKRHRFTIILKNKQLNPSELTIAGLKEWTQVEKKEIMLGLVLEEIEKEKRAILIRFLSRSEKLHVKAFLIEE